MEGVKAFYWGASACVRVDGEQSENFPMGVRLRQRCVMSPWLFNIFMNGCMRNKTRVVNVGARLKMNMLFADDTIICRE